MSAINRALHVCTRSGYPLKEGEIDPGAGWGTLVASAHSLGMQRCCRNVWQRERLRSRFRRQVFSVVLDHAHPAHGNLHITTAIMTDDKCSMKTAQKLSQLRLIFSWMTYTLIATCTHL